MKDTTVREVFPLVNEKDEVIGWAASGKEALHKSKARHRSVHVFIETFGGGFILQKKGPNSENAGTWSSAVSGHVEGDESYEDAAVRETKEELGRDIDEIELERICKVYPCEATNNEFTTLFTYLMDLDKEKIDPAPEEVLEVVRIPFKELLVSVDRHKDLYSPAFVALLNMYLGLQNMKGETT